MFYEVYYPTVLKLYSKYKARDEEKKKKSNMKFYSYSPTQKYKRTHIINKNVQILYSFTPHNSENVYILENVNKALKTIF